MGRVYEVMSINCLSHCLIYDKQAVKVAPLSYPITTVCAPKKYEAANKKLCHTANY